MNNFSTNLNYWSEYGRIPVVALVLGLGIGLYMTKIYFSGGVCRSKAKLNGKTVIVTGANSGIGKETARNLASRGARVILACRDLEKAEKAAAEIRGDSQDNEVVVMKLDLSSLTSVRSFVKDFLKKETRLDVLINNAGIMQCPDWKTEDGFEMQFGVNHLGHFLLTNLLLDRLKRSAPSRVVVVSSMVHAWIDGIDFDNLNAEKGYNSVFCYRQSKLANLLFTRELSRRLEGSKVTANALHPGVIMTEIKRYLFPSFIQPMVDVTSPLLFLLIFKSPKQGVQTSIDCAVNEDLESITGMYFSDCKIKTPSKHAMNEENARKLWDISTKMVGLD